MHPRTLSSLEGLRFFASFAIVLYHFIPYMERGLPNDVFWTGKFRITVDMFFVISGIVIANGYLGRTSTWRDYAKFIQRRFARIYPLHFATLTFYAFIGILSAHGILKVVSETKYAFGDLWANLLMVHAWGFSSQLSFNYVSWSISAEWFVYLVLPLIALLVARPLGLLVVAALLTTGIGLSHFWLGRSMPNLTWDISIIRALPSFALGVWLSANRDLLTNAVSLRVAAIGLAVSGGVFLVLLAVKANDYALLAVVYCVVVSAFICDLSHVRTPLAWSPISDLGKMTYSLYMLHPVVATTMLSFFAPKLFGTSYWVNVAAIGVSILITFGVAKLSYRYFEMPAQRMISSIGQDRANLAFRP